MTTWEDKMRLLAWISVVFALGIAMVLAAWPWPAIGGEIVTCSAEPGGKDWFYRTQVEGRPDKCWYQGKPMKPREELRWPVKADVPTKPEYTELVLPVRAQSEFEDRWLGLVDVPRIIYDATPIEQWR